ncbi:Glutamyl- or glutaminyl-tRNA synthetase (GlnS) (PDB:1EUQ) [Commensalibacter communis]|uniref:Glutamate--tRNA ligase n=1 Tax=Commensalibacter communis TaxID=2972786 RepID=A0A9W4X5Q7_9PROT|nr:glutamate--tRNA ligase [Commensalibacter communis]CAI3926286.1 Glutamyl- or glutaminyl-tRNA synthetase (GlnS) (PDB:1EUQ) [Commensalibacter communis]CAI3926911.1 Glutamyl- or glutaminyl-tRNA synthetase (GlnS) (PDB:1EUQ) [Commensalibacter communis]CAI3927824.1 Glutamyl- or glutaminyl-tRNA synthetase (GlnS) (PDB:1EUQ) [Commensalibacter communis]CAI3934684.1 Glutamyl- or glutaminyl-tRNA synthetase (GlnS) (PDB:1EUQ) [Commensalibacter communis]CAI3935198.1 Glutamyl- or glutaminyl-tRNA synthetase 
MTVRTRFAPSPTGLLHIGNARAALFNYLYAKHHNGQFLLRIEDTDKERSTQQAVDVIFDGLAWMGLTPDEEPVYQSTRIKRHQEVALHLLETGKAYKCFCTQEELADMRAKAQAEGKPPRYNGYWRDRDESEAPEGAPYTVRIKAPHEGKTILNDLVQGEVTVANIELDDMIILRADGTPTYQHAVVCDDHDMNITHVIRGDDHLTNTFRQLMIYRAMGWDIPNFAHLPLIHGPDGAKLSKRHGASSVVEFRDEGYLPEALCNYLLRLGWGHGDDEILDREEQIKLFDLDGVGRSPSRMDYAKLMHVNGYWLRQADDQRLVKDVVSRLSNNPDLILDQSHQDRLLTLMPGLKERAKNLVELAENSQFIFAQTPLSFTDKAQKLLTEENCDMLSKLASQLATLTPFTKETINHLLHEFAEKESLKLGKVAQPLRAAVTGSTMSPGIDDTLLALGKEEVLARLGAVTNG